MSRTVLLGRPYPLGATYDGYGTNFAIYSSVAERVVLCLFDGAEREHHVDLSRGIGDVWHCYLLGVRPGATYGYRVHGPWRPSEGLACNPHKLLLDPYARALTSRVRWMPSLVGYRGDPLGPRSHDDSASAMVRAVVSESAFEWGNDRRLDTPLSETLIYECHVRGATIRHRGVPAALRGTYAGFAHPAVVDHLRALGVTAVELLPIFAFAGEHDYWGYSPVAHFAPHPDYASTHEPLAAVAEVKHMVRTLHRAGIEVILSVTFRRTGEGDRSGPTLSLRGLDGPAYYRDDGTLRWEHPRVVQLVMDALRYWVGDMHVDGFRFDLAGWVEPRRITAFLDIVHQDPVVSRIKLLADGWNDRYRDSVRRFWRGDGPLGPLGDSLAGDGPAVNAITSHDGPTLRDLVAGDARQQRNLLATLLLSRGAPLVLGGDELGRTQRGNVNAYDQDNATSWLDWDGADIELLAFARALASLRRDHRALRGGASIAWLARDGTAMTPAAWRDARSVQLVLDGGYADDTFDLLVHAGAKPEPFVLPDGVWERVFDTARGFATSDCELHRGLAPLAVGPRSLWLMRRVAYPVQRLTP